MLTITTTHLKNGWIRRNGIPRSEKATVTEHLIRHGDYPDDGDHQRSGVSDRAVRPHDGLVLDPQQEIAPYPCESVVEVERPQGAVPHHLPGTNTFLYGISDEIQAAAEAARGGAETMYPEYRQEVRREERDEGGALTTACEQIIAMNQSHDSAARRIRARAALCGSRGSRAQPQNFRQRRGARSARCRATSTCWSARAATSPCRSATMACWWSTRSSRRMADKDAGRDPEAVGQADPLHHQHARPSAITPAATRSSRRPAARSPAAMSPARSRRPPAPHHRARERAEPHERAERARRRRFRSPRWPTDTYFTEQQRSCSSTAKRCQLLHQPDGAHRRRQHRVLPPVRCRQHRRYLRHDRRYPVIDLARGGSINGILDALNHIIDITIPADKQEGGTYVIPGHGRLCDEADVVEYRDMVDHHSRSFSGHGQEGHDARAGEGCASRRATTIPLLGSTTGFWTTDKFVEAVYKSLTMPPPASSAAVAAK